MKYWVVRDDNGKLKTVGAKGFVPKNSVGRAPVDPLTGEPEDAEWLQIETMQDDSGQEFQAITVNQTAKSQILAQRQADREAEKQQKEVRKQRLKDLKTKVRNFDAGNIRDIISVREALSTVFDYLREDIGDES